MLQIGNSRSSAGTTFIQRPGIGRRVNSQRGLGRIDHDHCLGIIVCVGNVAELAHKGLPCAEAGRSIQLHMSTGIVAVSDTQLFILCHHIRGCACSVADIANNRAAKVGINNLALGRPADGVDEDRHLAGRHRVEPGVNIGVTADGQVALVIIAVGRPTVGSGAAH